MPSILILLLTVIIWGFIFWLLWWGLGALALPEPFSKLGTLILVVAAIVVVIGILMGSIAPFPFLTTILH